MRLRIPDPIKFERLETPEEPKKAEGFRKSFQVELITPMYGGGVKAGEPDMDMPVRASAIRGQLRFWWRVLNSKKNFKDELRIWGGMSDSGAVASRVKINVKDLNPGRFMPTSCAKWQQKNKESWKHGAGYALGIQKDINKTVLLDLDNNQIISFILEISLTGEDAEVIWEVEILKTLRWWASFGGLGARTRRGLGSVKVSMDGDKSCSLVVDKEEAETYQCNLISLESKNKAIDAWVSAIGKLQKFRQGENVGRNPSHNNLPGRSRWPEADSIREITTEHLQLRGKNHRPCHSARQSFPRAAFGLPIITHFKNYSLENESGDKPDPSDTTLKPLVNKEKKERMASPLILKAMWMGRQYAPIALLLPHSHIEEMGLCLVDKSNDLLKQMLTLNDWYPELARKKMIEPKNNSPLNGYDIDGDVLESFLKFFAKK